MGTSSNRQARCISKFEHQLVVGAVHRTASRQVRPGLAESQSTVPVALLIDTNENNILDGSSAGAA